MYHCARAFPLPRVRPQRGAQTRVVARRRRQNELVAGNQEMCGAARSRRPQAQAPVIPTSPGQIIRANAAPCAAKARAARDRPKWCSAVAAPWRRGAERRRRRPPRQNQRAGALPRFDRAAMGRDGCLRAPRDRVQIARRVRALSSPRRAPSHGGASECWWTMAVDRKRGVYLKSADRAPIV